MHHSHRFLFDACVPSLLVLTLSVGPLALAEFTVAQDKRQDRATRPLIRVPTHLTLEEARIIIEAAKAVVQAENGRAACGCGF